MAFAILAADSLEALRSAAEEANLRYGSIFVSNENTKIEPEQTLIIFPNPTTGFLTLRLPENTAPLDVQAFDAQGKLLRNERLGIGQPLDVQALAPGMYSLRVVVGERVFAGKFVKQ